MERNEAQPGTAAEMFNGREGHSAGRDGVWEQTALSGAAGTSAACISDIPLRTALQGAPLHGAHNGPLTMLTAAITL